MYYVEDKQGLSSVLDKHSNGNFKSLKNSKDCKKVIICNSMQKNIIPKR